MDGGVDAGHGWIAERRCARVPHRGRRPGARVSAAVERAWPAFERLALEGPAQAPRLVAYFRAEDQWPGLLLAFEWPLAHDPAHLSFGVWLANLMELLDQAGCTLPAAEGIDGVARA